MLSVKTSNTVEEKKQQESCICLKKNLNKDKAFTPVTLWPWIYAGFEIIHVLQTPIWVCVVGRKEKISSNIQSNLYLVFIQF